MPVSELVTIPNVTLIETGDWNASTGPVTFTTDDLYAAVAALDDPAVKLPRMRFGHTGNVPMVESAGGFEEQPCVGKFTNLRVEQDGTALVADLVGVPKWLAEILPVAYPNRSVEAYFEVRTSTGKKHGMVVTSVALLGENLPAVQTLEDLEMMFSDDGSSEWVEALTAKSHVAASKGDDMPQKVSASVDQSDIRKAFYEQIATEESGRYWWWMHQMYIDPPVVIAEDDSGENWLIPYDSKSAEMGEPVQVFIQWVEKDSGKVAAAAGPPIPTQFGHPAKVYASAAASRPADRQHKLETNQKEETGSMPIDTKLLAAHLGLPEDATEEQINEALAAAEAAEEDTEETTAAETTEEVDTVVDEEVTTEKVPVAATSGVNVDAETWAQIQRDAAAGRAARAEQITARRTETVKAAVKAGKIPPSREGHYLSLMERDEQGTSQFLAGLESGVVPVNEIGSSEHADDGMTVQAQGTGLFPDLEARRAARQEA